MSSVTGLKVKYETAINRTEPPINNSGLPLDTEYADVIVLLILCDFLIDFNDKDEGNLRGSLPIATDDLKDGDFFVTEDEADFSH